MAVTIERERQIFDAKSELVVYFCNHVSLFEKSTCGAMIERLHMYSGSSETGEKFLSPSQAASKAWDYTERRTRVCNADGSIPDELTRFEEDFLCLDDPTITARKTCGEEGSGGHPEPDDAALMKFGLVSRRVSKLGIGDAKALVALYGPTGCKWEESMGAREPSIYELTTSGQKLLAKYCKEALGELRNDEILMRQVKQQKQWPEPARQQLIQAMSLQAINMHDKALNSYLTVKGHAAAA